MSANEPYQVGYVVKRYPRYSETFIVNEILAHEASNLPIDIFALRPSSDTHFQDRIAEVRAPVTYVPSNGVKAASLWAELSEASEIFPNVFAELPEFFGEDVRDVYQALLVAKDAREREIDHLHAHFGTVATTVARMASRLAGVPYTFTAHAKDIYHDEVDERDLELKVRDATAVVTVSDFNAIHLRERFPQYAEKIVRVYNGLDLSRFVFESPTRRPPQIVAVGRLVEKKGFSDLVAACSLLKSDGESFECKIVGEGELAKVLRGQIERLNVADQVQLVGPKPQREVIQLIRQARVVAAPCIHASDGNRDGLPTILLEAMALGTPCVSTSVTGIPEMINHDVTGLIVDECNPRALADALKELLHDEQLGVRFAENARNLVQEKFDIENTASELRSIFNSSGLATGEPVAETVIAYS